MSDKSAIREASMSELLGDDTKVIFVTEFDDEDLQAFYIKFMKLENDDTINFIPIVISSYGGYTDVLSAMRDIIKASTKPVATIAMGKAMSSGVALLASGTPGLRFATENTSIMIHEMSAGANGKASDITSDAQDVAVANRKFIKNLAKDMGKTFEVVRAELDRRRNANWYLTPSQAKQWGVIDHIGLPKLERKPERYDLVSNSPPKFRRRKKPART